MWQSACDHCGRDRVAHAKAINLAKGERQAAGIRLAKERGAYQGRRKGTTKAAPARALALRKRGLSISEIASALDVSKRTVFRYLTDP